MFKAKRLIYFILILGFILRSWGINTSPSGLSIDEASIGYNAWSIITTGKDEHGSSFPLFFEAFGEYKLPIYIYAVALVQLLVGLPDFSVRIPAVLFGLGTIICFYYFCRVFLEEFFDKNLSEWGALLGGFLMAISPWHIQFTRTGFEASSALFFVMLGVCLFFKGKKSGSFQLLIASLISLTLALYAYNSARIVVPVLIISLIVFNFKRYEIYQWIWVLTICFGLTIPFILFALSPEGFARAREVVIFYYPQTQNPVIEIAVNLWKNISPYYLFHYGDPTLSHTTPHRMSLLYFIEWPFFYAGLILLILKIRKSALILIWFLIGSVPAAITILNPHALRSFLILPALIFISVFGFLNFISAFKSQSIRKIFLSVYGVSLIVLCLNFLNIYHNFYVKDSGWDWLSDVKKVSEEITVAKNEYDQIYFEEGGVRPIAYLWHLKYPPIEYQKLINKKDIGNLHFGYPFSEVSKTGKNLYVSRGVLSEDLVRIVSYPNGTPAFYLYRI